MDRLACVFGQLEFIYGHIEIIDAILDVIGGSALTLKSLEFEFDLDKVYCNQSDMIRRLALATPCLESLEISFDFSDTDYLQSSIESEFQTYLMRSLFPQDGWQSLKVLEIRTDFNSGFQFGQTNDYTDYGKAMQHLTTYEGPVEILQILLSIGSRPTSANISVTIDNKTDIVLPLNSNIETLKISFRDNDHEEPWFKENYARFFKSLINSSLTSVKKLCLYGDSFGSKFDEYLSKKKSSIIFDQLLGNMDNLEYLRIGGRVRPLFYKNLAMFVESHPLKKLKLTNKDDELTYLASQYLSRLYLQTSILDSLATLVLIDNIVPIKRDMKRLVLVFETLCPGLNQRDDQPHIHGFQGNDPDHNTLIYQSMNRVENLVIFFPYFPVYHRESINFEIGDIIRHNTQSYIEFSPTLQSISAGVFNGKVDYEVSSKIILQL
eukprot:gene4325-5051_t